MKTFTNFVEEKVGDLFLELNQAPQLTGFITNGFPIAIAAYLSQKLYDSDNGEAELVIGGRPGNIIKFSLKAVKKGDSIAFVPEFELLDAGSEYINSDELSFDSKSAEEFANDLTKNKDFIECLRNAFQGSIYVNGEWETDLSNEERGLVFSDESDIAICAVCSVHALLEVLCNNKDASSDLIFEVPGLGSFKVSAAKDGYSVSLTFDKEFKSNCKSDKLAEKMALLSL